MKELFMTIMFMGVFVGLRGQNPVSLEECRRLALENNKKLKIAEEQVKSARFKKQEAFTKYLPGIDAMGTYLRNQRRLTCFPKMPIYR